MLIAVAAFSFEAPALSSLLEELLPLSLDLSPPLTAGFLLGAMAIDAKLGVRVPIVYTLKGDVG